MNDKQALDLDKHSITLHVQHTVFWYLSCHCDAITTWNYPILCYMKDNSFISVDIALYNEILKNFATFDKLNLINGIRVMWFDNH